MTTPRMVISIKSELPTSFVVVMATWFMVTVGVALFAKDTVLWLSAAGAAVGTSLVFLWTLRPRRGELIRLLLDLERRIVYWAHHGCDPEEVHFGSLKAIALEPMGSKRVRLFAVERTGRWVSLGHGARKELERFARAMSDVIDVPLWYRTGDAVDQLAVQEVTADSSTGG